VPETKIESALNGASVYFGFPLPSVMGKKNGRSSFPASVCDLPWSDHPVAIHPALRLLAALRTLRARREFKPKTSNRLYQCDHQDS